MKTKLQVWEVWTYDVWGNAEDGWDVNDRHCLHRRYEIASPVEVCNPGTPAEFEAASPTDAQIREALGLVEDAAIDTDGDDHYITVDASEDAYPLGELNLIIEEEN